MQPGERGVQEASGLLRRFQAAIEKQLRDDVRRTERSGKVADRIRVMPK